MRLLQNIPLRFESQVRSRHGWPSFYEPIDENAVDSRVDGRLCSTSGRKSSAGNARRTSAMSSVTARSQPDCATPSTRPPSTSRKPWPPRRRAIDRWTIIRARPRRLPTWPVPTRPFRGPPARLARPHRRARTQLTSTTRSFHIACAPRPLNSCPRVLIGSIISVETV